MNDGVTIAKEVELEDPVENIGAKLVRQAAARTNDTAGDGTTTATILSAAFIAEGLKIVAAGEWWLCAILVTEQQQQPQLELVEYVRGPSSCSKEQLGCLCTASAAQRTPSNNDTPASYATVMHLCIMVHHHASASAAAQAPTLFS